MGNRSFLYLVPAAPDAEGGGVQIAEANNNFPSLWQLMLAGGDAAPAITDQRVFGDAGTDNLAADAEAALERLRSVAEFVSRHPLLDQQPLLPLQFDALLAHLRASIDAVRGEAGQAVRVSANLDELAWLDDAGTPERFIRQCRSECDQRWAELRAAMRSNDHAAFDEALGLKTYGRDFSHWEAWAWEFGFSGVEHDYFHLNDEPRAMAFADFVPEPRTRTWEDDLSDGYRRFQRDGRWGVRWCDAQTGREREVLAPEWEEIRRANDGGVWVVRNGLHGYALLDPEHMRLSVEPELEEVWQFFEDADEGNPLCAIVQRGGQQGLLAGDGSWLLVPTVDEVWNYSHGYAPFRVGEREGFLGADGRVAIAADFDSVSSFSPGGVAAVWRGDLAGLVRGDGQLVLAPTYDELEWHADFRAFLITHAGKVGLCRADGSVWLAPEWEELNILLKRVQIAVRRGDRWGVFDWQGRERIAPRYDTLEARFYDDLDFDDETALARLTPWHKLLIVREGAQVGAVDEDGQVRVPIAYAAVESFETGGTVGRVEFPDRHVIGVVQRGPRRVRLRGVFDMDQQREIVAPEWNQLHFLTFGADSFGYLVSLDVPKRDRDRLGNDRVGVLRADGSVLFAPEYAWIGSRWSPSGDAWGVAIVRNAFAKEWGKGEPLQAVRNEDGMLVWLHADGRIEPHVEYLSRRYAATQDLKAARTLGLALRDGDGVAQDPAQARHWLWIATGADPAAEAAKPSAWRKFLGALVDDGKAEGATPEPCESARPRDVQAMYALSLMLQHGSGGPAQAETARAWLEFALTHGGADDPDVLSELGYMVCEGVGGASDRARGHALYEQAIEHDSKIALHNLALDYQHGVGVAQDLDRALDYFRRAERLGDASCAYHVGRVLIQQAESLTGAARRKRLSEALYALSPLIDSEIEHGDYACGEYARICLDREAKEYDPAKAEQALLRGAQRDNLECIELLIDAVYGNAESGLADAEKAAHWAARKAALEADGG